MSIKLYGFPISNYYNVVKAVMIEKGMDFEEVLVKPSQDADYLGQSPMGKVPCMETQQGFLTETGVMLDYLDSLGEGPTLFPADAFAKAFARRRIAAGLRQPQRGPRAATDGVGDLGGPARRRQHACADGSTRPRHGPGDH